MVISIHHVVFPPKQHPRTFPLLLIGWVNMSYITQWQRGANHRAHVSALDAIHIYAMG